MNEDEIKKETEEAFMQRYIALCREFKLTMAAADMYDDSYAVRVVPFEIERVIVSTEIVRKTMDGSTSHKSYKLMDRAKIVG